MIKLRFALQLSEWQGRNGGSKNEIRVAVS